MKKDIFLFFSFLLTIIVPLGIIVSMHLATEHLAIGKRLPLLISMGWGIFCVLGFLCGLRQARKESCLRKKYTAKEMWFVTLAPLFTLFIAYMCAEDFPSPLSSEIFFRKVFFAFGFPPLGVIFIILFIRYLIKFGNRYFDELQKFIYLDLYIYAIFFLYSCLLFFPQAMTHGSFGAINIFFLLNVFNFILVFYFIEVGKNFKKEENFAGWSKFLTFQIYWEKYIIAFPFWYLLVSIMYIFSPLPVPVE